MRDVHVLKRGGWWILKNEDFEFPSSIGNPFVAGYCKIQETKVSSSLQKFGHNQHPDLPTSTFVDSAVKRVTYDYC